MNAIALLFTIAISTVFAAEEGNNTDLVVGSHTYPAERITHTMSAEARLLQINILQPVNLCKGICQGASATTKDGGEVDVLPTVSEAEGGESAIRTRSRRRPFRWGSATEEINKSSSETAKEDSSQTKTTHVRRTSKPAEQEADEEASSGSTSSGVTITRSRHSRRPLPVTSNSSASSEKATEVVTSNGTTITKTFTIPAGYVRTTSTSVAADGKTITRTFTIPKSGNTAKETKSSAAVVEAGPTTTVFVENRRGRRITVTYTITQTALPTATSETVKETATVTTTDDVGEWITITRTFTITGRGGQKNAKPTASLSEEGSSASPTATEEISSTSNDSATKTDKQEEEPTASTAPETSEEVKATESAAANVSTSLSTDWLGRTITKTFTVPASMTKKSHASKTDDGVSIATV